MASNFWNGEFYFDSEPSSKYKVCIVDINNSEKLKQIGGSHTITIDKEFSYNGNHFYKESEKTSDEITLQLCRTDNKPWGIGDIIEINNWLFKKNFKRFQPLDLLSNQGYNIIYYLKAIEMKKFLNPNMEGYLEIRFRSYTAHAYAIPQGSITLKTGETRVINNISNTPDIYYPKIKITEFEGDEETIIVITNNTNGKSLTIKGLKNAEIVTIDCAIGSVINSNNENRFIILQDYNFIGLEKGKNNISISSSNGCKIEFICEFPVII